MLVNIFSTYLRPPQMQPSHPNHIDHWQSNAVVGCGDSLPSSFKLGVSSPRRYIDVVRIKTSTQTLSLV